MSNRIWNRVFKHTIASWKKRRRTRSTCRNFNEQFQLLIEPLEDRRMMAVVNWINAAGGAWNVGSNWSTNSVPGIDDDVVIDVPGANVTIQAVDDLRA